MEITVKRFVKDILAQLDYSLYRAGIRSCPVKVHTIEETIDAKLWQPCHITIVSR